MNLSENKNVTSTIFGANHRIASYNQIANNYTSMIETCNRYIATPGTDKDWWQIRKDEFISLLDKALQSAKEEALCS